MNGEEEEDFSPETISALVKAAEFFAGKAIVSRAIFPSYQMAERYIKAVFEELLSSMALYAAQKRKGCREVDLPEAEEAIDRLTSFMSTEPEELAAAGVVFLTITTYEDLNAIAYYGRRMKKEDFLLGRLHRPWSNLVISTQLDLYLRMGLVEEIFTGEGDMLVLTERGYCIKSRRINLESLLKTGRSYHADRYPDCSHILPTRNQSGMDKDSKKTKGLTLTMLDLPKKRTNLNW